MSELKLMLTFCMSAKVLMLSFSISDIDAAPISIAEFSSLRGRRKKGKGRGEKRTRGKTSPQFRVFLPF